MKDVVLLAASVYLLKQDALRVMLSAPEAREPVRAEPASCGLVTRSATSRRSAA
jgi:hypothetical protein